MSIPIGLLNNIIGQITTIAANFGATATQVGNQMVIAGAPNQRALAVALQTLSGAAPFEVASYSSALVVNLPS